ncbi:MAG: M14 family metallopeptidase [Bullifex sp.]|nr:M14 family metallopeptidase [Spirochaetales bacterium]MDD7536010.1 M14 family metallopeptidase [Spirochaetales bacterium]MDY3849198.1 M14 family metallopeptidase [Bullifex sp.]MDY5777648.1 M14 family metallopeptidase [Bullifex sp.]
MIKDVVDISLPVDETFRIRKNRVENRSRTKRFSLVTGIHGDELEGQYVAFRINQILRENIDCVDGIVDIYPGMNPLGVDSVTRGIPAFDLDMNRIFPGRSDGDMNEYVASRLIDDIAGSDLVIDIHASNIFLTEIPQIRINEISADRLVPLARKANVDLIWVHGAATVLESTLAYALNDRNTPTLVAEVGVGMRITKEYGDQLTAGILSLLKELGIYSGECPEVREPVISSDPDDVIFLNAPSSGIFIQTAHHGAILEKGEEVGIIVNPLTGDVLSRMVSPERGWLFTIREYPVTDQGSLIARILKKLPENAK